MHASRAARHPLTHGDGGGPVGPGSVAGGNKARGERSDTTAPMGLKNIEEAVVVLVPPQVRPTRVAMVEQRGTRGVPVDGVTQVAVTGPPVQPVLLPTLVTTVPISGGPAVAVTVSMDVRLGKFNEHGEDVAGVAGDRQRVFGRAIASRAAFWLPMSTTAKAESLLRQRLPVGQPGMPGTHTGSALSCAT